MGDYLSPDNFQTLAAVIIAIVSGFCLVVSGLAAWTLKYIVDIARDMAITKTSCQSIDKSLTEFKQENGQDHKELHGRITKVEDVNHEQGLLIHGLQKGNC